MGTGLNISIYTSLSLRSKSLCAAVHNINMSIIVSMDDTKIMKSMMVIMDQTIIIGCMNLIVVVTESV